MAMCLHHHMSPPPPHLHHQVSPDQLSPSFTIFTSLQVTPAIFHVLSSQGGAWSTDLDGVIPNVVFTLQPHFSCSYLPLICLSTNQNIQLIHSLLIRIEWTTGNGILVSSSHWPIYNKLYHDLTCHVLCHVLPTTLTWSHYQHVLSRGSCGDTCHVTRVMCDELQQPESSSIILVRLFG